MHSEQEYFACSLTSGLNNYSAAILIYRVDQKKTEQDTSHSVWMQ